MSSDVFIIRDADGNEHRAAVTSRGVIVDERPVEAEVLDQGAIRLSGARAMTAYSVAVGDERWVFLEGEVFRFEIARGGQRRRRGAAAHGSLTAPMPATVRRVEAQAGQAVRRGDILIVLEAMKMELPVRAPADGTVTRVNCREGDLVPAGHELVVLEP